MSSKLPKRDYVNTPILPSSITPEQMGLELPKVRPAVLRDETLEQLQDYRGFRHVAIHRYGFELKLNRIQELVISLLDCGNNLTADLQLFCDFLEKLDA